MVTRNPIDVVFPAVCLAIAAAFLIQIKTFVLSEAEPARQAHHQKRPDKQAGYAPNVAPNFEILRRKITYGNATLYEVHQALTEKHKQGLANTVHALFGMRIHRGVSHALDALWLLDKEKYPDFSWPLIETNTLRIAIASTLNRINIVDTDEYLDFIRSQKTTTDSFDLAQVCVALGFNGSPTDLSFLKTQAAGDDHYVAQSAITALSVFGGNKARDTLIELAQVFADSARGNLITDMLKTVYDWPPPELNPLVQ